MMIPVKFSKTTNVKNLRYVLNQSSAIIHRLIFGFGGAGFLTVVSSTLALAAFCVVGHDSDSSGTLDSGVIPSWTGEAGESRVSK